LANLVHWQVWTDGCLDEMTTFVSGLTHMSKEPKWGKTERGRIKDGAPSQVGKNILFL
jgi:hypothetical protein